MTFPSTTPIIYREATVADIPAVTAIYGHHVLTGLASFEEIPPDVREMERRFKAIRRQRLPYLVAERNGELIGYAYASLYRTRSAYRFTLEDSIYLRPDAVRRGTGQELLRRLIRESEALGFRRMIAVIGDSAHRPSIRLHEIMGFMNVGILPSVGFKFGRWVDSVLMQRPIGAGDATIPTER